MSDLIPHEERSLHFQAVNLLKEIESAIVDSKFLIIREHFEFNNDRTYNIIKLYVNNVITCIDRHMNFPRNSKGNISNLEKLKKYKAKGFKKEYNNKLNYLLHHTKKESQLHNLLFINNNFELENKKKIYHVDHINLISIGREDKITNEHTILRLSEGRCGFEDQHHVFQFLMHYVETAPFSKLCHSAFTIPIALNAGSYECRCGTDFICFCIKIEFAGGSIRTDSPRIKHILFGSNWKQTDLNFETCSDYVKSTPYYQFNLAVNKKIMQLISTGYEYPEFPYKIISCFKSEPPCKKDSVILKNRNKKRFTCQCHFELCGECGKEYHGESSCSVPVDETTNSILEEERTQSKQCPQCQIYGIKENGCNHMTCVTCRCQYCWLCNIEFSKDRFGKYEISPHYVGYNSSGVCVQT